MAARKVQLSTTDCEAAWSLKCYQSNFAKISDNFIKYTEPRTFANKLKLYLQDGSTKSTYTSVFDKFALEKEQEEADKDTNIIADINAKKLAVLASKMIENDEGSSSAAANEKVYDIDETTDELSNLSTSRQRESSSSTGFEQIEQPPLTYSLIKKAIMKKAANEIHTRLQKNRKITPDEEMKVDELWILFDIKSD